MRSATQSYPLPGVGEDQGEGGNGENEMLNAEYVMRIGTWVLGIKKCAIGIAECAACSEDFRLHCKLKGGIYHEERIERTVRYEQGHAVSN
jgi:hypothetical protein